MAGRNGNKLTPGRNMIWEASRMMLPEHKARIIEHRETLGRKERPVLDEQEAEQLARRISEAYAAGEPVTLTLFGDLIDWTETGIVGKIDPQRGRIQLLTEGGGCWLPFEDVIGAE